MSSFMLSCGNESNDEITENVEKIAVEEPQKSETNVIELNNGEKWLVNAEMKPFVIKGEQLVNDYVTNNSIDYKTLATQLKEQNDQLISSCTMDGKSHEVLHEWLHPHIGLVKELANASTTEEGNEIVMRLKESYDLYNEYFQ